MKNQIDPSTPFLAFYDLLRIRGIYSDEEKREKLRRGFRRAMALAAVLVGLVLPQAADASVLGSLATDGVIPEGSHKGLDGGDLMVSGDDLKIGAEGTGDALFQTSHHWDVPGGTLTGGKVFLLAEGGISFGAATFNVDTLVSAAINREEFSLGGELEVGNVTGEITGSAGGSGSRIYIGTSVEATGGTIVQTGGLDNGAMFKVGNGTITFKGKAEGDNLKLKAGSVTFEENAEVAGGTVDATDGTISGNFTQSDGTMIAGTVGAAGDSITQTGGTLTAVDKIQAAVTQNQAAGKTATIHASTIDGAVQQTAGTIDAGTAALALGSGSSLGGTVTAGSVTVGETGTLTLKGNAGLADTSVTAGTLALDAGSAAITLNSLSANTLQGTAGEVKVDNSKALSLGAITATSLDVTAGGAITQSGAVTSTERTTLSGTSITLERTDNGIGKQLGATASDGNVSIVNNGAIRIEAGQTVSGKNVSLEARGDNGYILIDKRTVDSPMAVVSATDASAGTITLASHGAIGEGLPTTGIRQGTGAGVAAKNLVVHAAKNDGTALDVQLNRDGDSNVNSVQTLSGNGGAVSIKTSTALELGALNVESLDAKANGGDITQSAATTITKADGTTTLDAGENKIILSRGVVGATSVDAGMLMLKSDTDVASDVTVSGIDADGKAITQNGAGTISVSGADGIVASRVSQTYNGTEGAHSTIRADRIEADFVQTGSYAAVDAHTESGTLDIQGNVAQDADNGVIGSSSTNVQLGDTGKPLDQDKGTINAKELLLRENSTSADTIYAERITLQRSTGTWLELDQDGPGTITVTGAGITGSRIIQSSTGTIRTDRINDIPSGGFEPLPAEDGIGGRIDQTGAATLQAYNAENGLKIGGHLYQQNEGAVVGTDGEDVEIFGWAATEFLKQDAGTINARTLTIHGDSTAAGNVTAGKIAAADGITLTQNGAGTIKAAGTGEIELDVAVVQNDAGATIGSTDTSVKVNKAFTQTAGKIEASKLTLNNAANDYALESTGNNVATLSGTAKSVTLDNTARTDKLSLSGLNVETDAGNTVTVKKAADVELAGVTAKEITVTEAGAVTDTDAQTAATTVRLGDAANAKTVGSVLLKNGTGAITVEGINASGNVGIQNASITQNGAISGANVTLDQTAGNLTVGKNISATDDILVRSAGAVEVGDATTAPTLSAGNNVVVTGAGVTVDNANLAAGGDGVGIQSSAALTVQNAKIIAPTVILETTGTGDLTVGNDVDMRTSDSTSKDAALFINAGGKIVADLSEANRPSDNLTVAKGALDLTGEKQVDLQSLVYKTAGDVDMKFSGEKLALESTGGNVKVQATGANLEIVKGTVGASGSGETSLSARDVTVENPEAANASVKVVGAAGTEGGNAEEVAGLVASGSDKTVTLDAAGNVTVASGAKISGSGNVGATTADGKDFTVAQGGTVESTAGSVSITAGGALDVAGTVQTTADGKNVTLATNGTGDNAQDVAISGTVTAANELAMTAADGKKIDQTAGTITAGAVTLASNAEFAGDVTAASINATGKTVTQDGAGAITADSITADSVAQTHAGTADAHATINADTISATTFTQSGAYASASAKTAANGITITGAATQTGANATIGAVDQAVTLGSLDQDAGAVNATTLTLNANSTAAGNITAGKISAADGVTLTQDGAGTIKAAGTGEIELDVAVEQNADGATIGSTDTSVKVNKAFTQTAGKIEASTLTLNNAANDYALESTGNNVATLSGTAKSVTLDNTARTGKLSLSGLNVGTGDGNTVTVKKAADVELAGVTAKEIVITDAATVTDSGTSVAAGAVKIDKSSSVTLDDAETLAVDGIASSGAVVLDAGTITQNGDVSGTTVSMTQTGTGGLALGNVTATGAGDAGTVSVTTRGGAISQKDDTAVTAPGAATFTAQNEAGTTTYDITVENPDNAFGSVGATGKDVKIQEKDGVALNAIAADSLAVTAGGAVSQNAAAEVTGATSVTVTDGSKVDLNNDANKLGSVGVVGKTENTGAAGEVTVVDSDGTLALDAIRASKLTVTANGEVSQNAAAEVTGATAVTVADGIKVDLNNDANRLGSVGVVGKTDKAGAVTVVDADGTLALDAVKAASLDVAAAGAVSQNAAAEVTGATAVTVADGSKVDLNNAENKLGSVGVVGKTENTGAAGEVTVVDSDSTLKLDAIRATKLTVTANGEVSQNAAAGVTGATTVTVADGSKVDLNNDANQLGSVGVAGKTDKAGAVTVVDSVGTLALDAVKAASLNVMAKGGEITQNAAAEVTGTTIVMAQSADGETQHDITLANEGNQLEGKVTATGKDVSVADAKALELDVTAASVAATVTGAGNGVRIASTQAADLEVKDVSAAAGDVVIKTTGKANVTGPVSADGTGKGVAIVSTGDAGGVDISGNVSADKDIVVRADNAAVGLRKGTEAGAVAPILATPKGSIVLEGKSVSVGEATLKAPTGTYGQTPADNDAGGVGIRATGTDAGDGIVLSGSTLVAKNVVLDSAKVVTVGKFDDTDAGTKVAMTASEGDEAGSRLVIAAEGDVKGYFDSANRPTESIRIVKSKKISTGESVDLNEFALKTTEDIDEFTFNGSRLALESEGAVHVTVGGDDVTIFNNALYGDKKTTVEASDVSADPAETVKVELGVDPSAAAGGLIGDSIDFKVADGAKTSVTVEENATIRSTKDLSVTLPGDFTVASGATVKGAGAVSFTAGGKVLVEGAKTVAENNGERQVAAAEVTGKSVALTTNGTDEKADDISIAGSVTTTGGGEAKLTSAKDIALSGAVTSAGKATLKAENGTVRQTAGTLQSAGLEITAKDVQQNGGAITATGETVATATDGSVKLDATAANGAAANDFDSVKASAKNAISITDKDELTVANAAGSADGATATTGDIAITAAGNLTVSGPANAGGNALLEGTSIVVAETGSVTANGTGNALLKATASVGTVAAKGAVKGANVTLDAPAGVTTSDNGTLESTAGDVYVHADAENVQIGSDVTATGNAVFKADAGAVELSDVAVVDAAGVGLQGNGLAEVRASNLGAGVRDLALVATAGGATLSGVPADVGNIGISVTGGNLVVTASGDRTFNGATVNASAVGGDGTAAARAPETGVTAAGLSAIGNNASLDVTITDGTITVGNVTASGDATITATDGAIVANGNVTAGGATVVSAAGEVTAGSIAGDTVDVTAGGQVTTTQGGILGANGTTVNSVGIQSAGNVGQGGDTTIEAGGGAVTAPALASGGLLDVNNAGAVTAAIAAGGDAQIQAASLVAGTTAAGGNLTFDEVAGPADVGTLAVGGDMNGTVGGLFTTLGGAAGSVGQQGGFNANGGVLQNGVLNTGAVNVNAANYQMNGDLNAGGAAVNIVAGGGIQGGANAVLRSGQLTLQGGDIGTAANPLQLRSGTIVNLTGQNLYLEEIVDGDRIVNIGTIDANGVLELHAPYLGTAANTGIRSNNGNSSIHSGGDMVLDIGGRVGTMDDPINVSIDNGSLSIGSGNLEEQGPDFIHLRLNGNDYVFLHTLVDNPIGWVIVGNRLVVGNLRQMRLINRALAFTVNTPELKSKQGIFGDPAFVHTKMNASEARSVGNMDMLALNTVDFRKTWTAIQSGASTLRKWSPAVFVNQNPLRAKLQAQQAEMETQPDIWVKTPAAPPASSESGSRSE